MDPSKVATKHMYLPVAISNPGLCRVFVPEQHVLTEAEEELAILEGMTAQVVAVACRTRGLGSGLEGFKVQGQCRNFWRQRAVRGAGE